MSERIEMTLLCSISLRCDWKSIRCFWTFSMFSGERGSFCDVKDLRLDVRRSTVLSTFNFML